MKSMGLALLVAEILHDRLEINGPKVKIAWVVKIWVDIQWCTQEAVNYFCEKLHPRCLTGFWINLHVWHLFAQIKLSVKRSKTKLLFLSPNFNTKTDIYRWNLVNITIIQMEKLMSLENIFRLKISLFIYIYIW